MSVKSEAIEVFKDAGRTSLTLFKIMIPVSIIVKILSIYGVVDILANYLTPVMGIVGLPGDFGLVWGTTMITNIYGGMVVFFNLSLQNSYSVAQVTALATMMLIAHTFPIEVRIAQKEGIELDKIPVKLKKRKKRSKRRNQNIRKKRLTRKAIEIYKKRIQNLITFKQGSNVNYKKQHYTNLLFHMTNKDDYAENGSDTLREKFLGYGMRCPSCNKYIPAFAFNFIEDDTENKVICPRCNKIFRLSPQAQTMFHHLKKFSLEDIQRLYFRVLEAIWIEARKYNVFNSKNVTLAIDCTSRLCYGSSNTPGTHSTEDDKDKICYRFITVSIVENGKRFVLMAIPFTRLNTKCKLVKDLLLYARKKVKIGLVLFDKGFYSEQMIKTLDSLRLFYVILMPKNKKIKKMIKRTNPPTFQSNYEMKSVVHTVVLNNYVNRKGEEGITAYATNLPMAESDIEGSAERVSALYRKRWGIETGYRIIKHSFGLRTTSRDFRIRLFYFLFSTIVYNLWILIDILVWIDLMGEVGAYHQVKSKYFRALICIIDPGG